MDRRMLCQACIAILLHMSAQGLGRAATHYVSLSGNHVAPFTDWGDAATNIQSAIDVAVSDARVLVSNGTYRLQTEVIIGTNITLESASGKEATIVDGCHTTRCFRLLRDAGCVVRGFSITNGLVAMNEAGGGVWIGEGNSLVDCVVSGCAAGMGGGLFINCGEVGFDVDGCTVSDNTATVGGGVCASSVPGPIGTVSNLVLEVYQFADALAALDIAITNILADLATGPVPLPVPNVPDPQGCPEPITVPSGQTSGSHLVRNCEVEYNTAVYGGGFLALGTPELVISNCFIARNDSECGGGLFAQEGGIILDSTLAHNDAETLGGGIIGFGDMDIINCRILSNSAGTAAGGCWLAQSWVLVEALETQASSGSPGDAPQVRGSEFIGNDAVVGGGLVLIDGVATRNTFFQNSAIWGGGGIASLGGTVSASVLSENSAGVGGGIMNGGAVSSCVIRYNSADMGGGVASVPFSSGAIIAVWPPPPGHSPVVDCDVLQNVALGGGGVALLDSGPLTACTVVSNSAGMAGGGVLTILRSEIHSSVVHGNSAGDGAGIYCLDGGDTVQCTVTANDAAYSGGGLFVVTSETGFGGQYNTDAFVGNAIVHGNSASNAPNFLNLASNVICSYTCTFPTVPGTGNITNSPLFADAAGQDYHLQPSSPCIDAGNNGLMPSDTDLDGLSRPLDGDNDGTATVDMGCYEHLNSAADSDGDTMPDGWEFDHGLNLVSDDSEGDADNDTINNGGEYAADTDPQDGNSVLSILDISSEMGGIRIDWKGGRNAWQFLECRSHLVSTSENWQPILALPPPTAVTNAVIDLGATGEAIFYRIRAVR